MDSNSNSDGKPIAPNARLGEDGARAGFDPAPMEGGRNANAGQNVVQLCLPLVENEVGSALPLLESPSDPQRGNPQPEMTDVMLQISEFRAKRDAQNVHDQSIASTIEEMLQSTHSDKSSEVAEIASNPRVHEVIEDEVIRPAVVLGGK